VWTLQEEDSGLRWINGGQAEFIVGGEVGKREGMLEEGC